MVNQYHIEVWAWIPGYEGMYQASTLGEIRSFYSMYRSTIKSDPQRIMKPQIDPKGHLYVGLKTNGIDKKRSIHTLMGETFMNHKYDSGLKMIVDHRNNIKTDNCLFNLQIISQRENSVKDANKENHTSKYVGVCYIKNKYRATIRIGKYRFNLGSFDNEEDAAKTYKSALSLHNDGKSIASVLPKGSRKRHLLTQTNNHD